MVLARLNQLLGVRTVNAFGPAKYACFLARVAQSVPLAVRRRSMKAIDEVVGQRLGEMTVRHQGVAVRFNCAETDVAYEDGTYEFGAIRELCIADCYGRHLPSSVLKRPGTAVDLGANRGVFTSILLAHGTRNVLAVEMNPELRDVFERNVDRNRHGPEQRVLLINQKIESGGDVLEHLGRMSNAEQRVSLLKMDIEGSERLLFAETAWLGSIDAITMEVHPQLGADPIDIIQKLTAAGFTSVASDTNFEVCPPSVASYIAAWRSSSGTR